MDLTGKSGEGSMENQEVKLTEAITELRNSASSLSEALRNFEGRINSLEKVLLKNPGVEPVSKEATTPEEVTTLKSEMTGPQVEPPANSLLSHPHQVLPRRHVRLHWQPGASEPESRVVSDSGTERSEQEHEVPLKSPGVESAPEVITTHVEVTPLEAELAAPVGEQSVSASEPQVVSEVATTPEEVITSESEMAVSPGEPSVSTPGSQVVSNSEVQKSKQEHEVQPLTPEGIQGMRQALEGSDWEQILGGNWFVRIGALALVLGVGFFLKMAFDNNWIGDAGKVSLGIITGLVLLGIGEYYYKPYPVWGQTVTIASIPVLYLSIYASFAFYYLIPPLAAFGFMALVTLTAGVLALRHESLLVAILGIIGGFLTPLLFNKAPINESIVLTYVEILDLGILGLVILRNWRGLVVAGQLGTLVLFGFWYAQSYTPERVLLAEGALTIFFLTFVGATTLFYVIWRREPEPENLALIVWNAAQYFCISVGLLWLPYRGWLGGFALCLALLYGFIAYFSFKRQGGPIQVPVFSLSLALVFLTLAIPLQFNGGWITIAWAAEGAVLGWVGMTLGNQIFRYCGVAFFPVVVLRLLVFDIPVDIRSFQPILNERFLTFGIAIALMYLQSRLYWHHRDKLKEGEGLATGFFLAANFFSLLILNIELINYFDSRAITGVANLANAKLLSFTLLWTLYATAVIAIGAVRSYKPVRLLGTILLAAPVIKLFGFDIFMLEMGYRVAAFMSLGILLIIMGFMYARHGRDVKGFFFD